MKLCKVGLLGLGISLSGLVFANNFSNADDLFAKRNIGANDNEKFQSSAIAHKAYEDIYSSASTNEEDKLYALIQMGRLDLFRGAILSGADLKLRKKALDGCMTVSGKAAYDSKRQEPHYYYMACLAGLAKISNFLERVPLAVKMKKEEAIALETTKVGDRYIGGFEGGGILRVLAGIYVNAKAKKLGLYNPQQGLNFANSALDTPSKISRPFPDAMSGKDWYENFYYQAQGKLSVGIENNDLSLAQDARNTLSSAIDAIKELEEAGALPSGREPEILRYLILMQDLKSEIQACESAPKWVKCMEEKLGD